MSASQYELWKFTHITIDLVDGRGSGFSVEAPGGQALPHPVAHAHRRRGEELGIEPRFALAPQPLLR